MLDWRNNAPRARDSGVSAEMWLMQSAAEWGADAQLEKCCEWLSGCGFESYGRELHAAMRPKPPSLKKQALAVLDDCADSIGAVHENALRRALESLPDTN